MGAVCILLGGGHLAQITADLDEAIETFLKADQDNTDFVIIGNQFLARTDQVVAIYPDASQLKVDGFAPDLRVVTEAGEQQ